MAAAPMLLARFEAARAEVEISLLEDDHARLLDGLREGRLDLCLTYDLQVPAGVAFEPLAIIEPQAILPLDHPLAAQGSVTPEELAAQPMVLIDLPGSSA